MTTVIVANFNRRPSGKFPSEIYAPELIPNRYRIIEDVETSLFKPSRLMYKKFIRRGQVYVPGFEMCETAHSFKGILGLVGGKRLLAHQSVIPTRMRDKRIILAGTVLEDPVGGRVVFYLHWTGQRWSLIRFDWLENNWYCDGRIVCLG